MSGQPALSVIVAVVSDAEHLRGCLSALQSQNNPPSMEVIVPHDGRDAGLSRLNQEFPGVHFLAVSNLRSIVDPEGSSREHHDELRARGLAAAQGSIVALLEDHGRAHPDWARRIVELHQQPCAAAGGPMENEVDRALNWAVYFSDFGRYQNPVPSGPSYFLTDANVSYKREVLESIRSVWIDSFHETTVHRNLLASGKTLWLSPEPVVYQHRLKLTVAKALKERYIWGRSFAGTRVKHSGTGMRLSWMAFSPLIPFVLLARKTVGVAQKKRLISEYIKALPLLALLTLFWSLGEFVGYATGKPSGRS